MVFLFSKLSNNFHNTRRALDSPSVLYLLLPHLDFSSLFFLGAARRTFNTFFLIEFNNLERYGCIVYKNQCLQGGVIAVAKVSGMWRLNEQQTGMYSS